MQRIPRTESTSYAVNDEGGRKKNGTFAVPQNILKDRVQLYENM